jgi:hypothetical protein
MQSSFGGTAFLFPDWPQPVSLRPFSFGILLKRVSRFYHKGSPQLFSKRRFYPMYQVGTLAKTPSPPMTLAFPGRERPVL